MPALSLAPALPSEAPAVIFDCDGLLADTEQQWEETLHEWMAQLGLTGDTARLRGATLGDTARHLATLARIEPRAIEHDISARYRSALGSKPGTMPGAAEFVAALPPHTKVAVVSNGRREDVEWILTTIGFPDLTRVLVCADDVRHGKPHPEPYLRAARLLRVTPESCIAFEDSETGCRAARSAGMFVVGVQSRPIPLECDARFTDLVQARTAFLSGTLDLRSPAHPSRTHPPQGDP